MRSRMPLEAIRALQSMELLCLSIRTPKSLCCRPRQNGSYCFIGTLSMTRCDLSHCKLRIGSTSMIHLLSETSLFLALQNDCYMQLSGVKLLDLWNNKPSASKAVSPGQQATARAPNLLTVPTNTGSLKRSGSSAECLPIAKKRKITPLEVLVRFM